KPSRFRPHPPHAEATWLKPELVCEIHYTEVTAEGVFRHPAFVAMREDKEAKAVTSSEEQSTLVNPSKSTQVTKINGHELKFTNLKKVLWPDEEYTKGDMLNYYAQVAPFILPYLKDRPQSLNRFPN